ncbi:MAG: DUF3261 domain-containing protein [Gammaproteobacteria bacterium]|nr:DUF3261 domain-containing protein [Gammaproteobacteria bacterium]
MRIRTWGLLLLVSSSWLCLSGCPTVPATGNWSAAINWAGLASRWMGPDDYRVEIVTFHDLRKSERYHARYDIELNRRGLSMVAQTPLGVPLYELEVRDGVMTTKSHVEQLGGLSVEQTLADFVLAYWPLDELMEAASAAGYSIQQADTIRRLLNSQAEILVEVIREVEDGDVVTRVVHHDIPLRIDIRTASGGNVRW